MGPPASQWGRLLTELQASNGRLWEAVVGLSAQAWADVLAYAVGTYTCTLLAAWLLSGSPKRSSILFCELLIVPILCFPWILPGETTRMCMGLHNFVYALYINGRALQLLGTSVRRHRPLPFVRSSSRFYTFISEVAAMHFYYIPPFVTPLPTGLTLPSTAQLLHFTMQVGIWDSLTFVIKELIPAHVAPANQVALTALVGGVWAMYSINICYASIALQCQLLGYALPIDLVHFHPLLSASVAEFWGLRWNPFIGKLLRFSIYEPARRLTRLPPAACMALVFVGSAVLHAWPQWQSTRELGDAACMLLFFLLQGVAVVVERWLCAGSPVAAKIDQALRHPDCPSVKQCPYQFGTEALVVASLVGVLFLQLEGAWTRGTVVAAAVLLLVTVAALAQLQSGYFSLLHARGLLQARDRRVFVTHRLRGCLLTLVCLVISLPYFSLPMLRATDALYAHSFVAGPLARTLRSELL